MLLSGDGKGCGLRMREPGGHGPRVASSVLALGTAVLLGAVRQLVRRRLRTRRFGDAASGPAAPGASAPAFPPLPASRAVAGRWRWGK
jgi:hypothetical protein